MTKPRGEGRQRGAPTMADVARAAGVSSMTVSRVVNLDPAVRPTTRRKVEDAISRLSYVPNTAAQALAGADAIRIGLLHSNPSAAYLSELMMGGLEQVEQYNAQLVVAQCDSCDAGLKAAQTLLSGRVDGVIVPSPLCDNADFIELLRDSELPAVLVASGRPSPHFSAVGIEEFAAARAMTQHIISLGHTRIGFVIGNQAQTASAMRLSGYQSALRDAGLAADPQLIEQGEFTYRSGFEAALRLLERADPPTAVFASNDDMAAAVVAVAHKLHLDVPTHLTVCGFDDTSLATTIWPALTTVRQPIADMSRLAVDLLLREIRQTRSGAHVEHRHEVLDFAIIRRESDGPPVAIASAAAG